MAYHSLANDLEGVSFSSIRSGTLDDDGLAHLEDVPPGPVEVEFGEDARVYKPHDTKDLEPIKNPMQGDAIDIEMALAIYAAAAEIEGGAHA